MRGRVAAVGIFLLRQERRLTRTGQRVTGTVTDLRWHSHATQGGGGYTTYHAVLSFRTPDGQQRRYLVRDVDTVQFGDVQDVSTQDPPRATGPHWPPA